MMIVWWFLPSCGFFDLNILMMVNQLSGRLHRVVLNYYSRSPLSEPELFLIHYLYGLFSDVGEITQGRIQYLLSFSPLLIFPVYFFLLCYFMSGRIHRSEYYFSNSRSPTMNRIIMFFKGHILTPFFDSFLGDQFCLCLPTVW